MRDKRVLIISAAEDVHAKAVGKSILELGGRVELIDLRQFPIQSRLTMRRGDRTDDFISVPGLGKIRSRDVTSVWWRRPQRLTIDPAVSDPAFYRFAYQEAEAAIKGFWRSFECPWVNEPGAESTAARKPWQLEVASEAGLRVPATIVTNDPNSASEFIEEQGGDVVYKALGGLPDAWRETRRLRDAERSLLHAVRVAPVIFQQALRGNDIRVTVIGDEIFAAEMESSKSRYSWDIRMDMTVPTRSITLDHETASGIGRLMHRMGLTYGAIDFRRDQDGQPWFLEINPSGQFLYIEELCSLPITATLARLLTQ